MGQKVNPISMRVQATKDWRSKWFVAGKKNFAKNLADDLRVRKFIEERFATRGVIDRVDIERSPSQITVNVWTAKAGVVIGRGGVGVQEIKASLEKMVDLPVRLNIEEVSRPDLAAKIVGENIAHQLERRINFRRAVKTAIQNVMSAGAKGVRIEVAGRLNGAEMSRREKFSDGSVPLHTIRANIDYNLAVAKTSDGTIGIKVWINKGERR